MPKGNLIPGLEIISTERGHLSIDPKCKDTYINLLVCIYLHTYIYIYTPDTLILCYGPWTHLNITNLIKNSDQRIQVTNLEGFLYLISGW